MTALDGLIDVQALTLSTKIKLQNGVANSKANADMIHLGVSPSGERPSGSVVLGFNFR